MENGLSYVGARCGGRTITDLGQLLPRDGQGIHRNGRCGGDKDG